MDCYFYRFRMDFNRMVIRRMWFMGRS